MNMENTRRYEMLVRVADFGTAHADIFPADSLGGQMFAAAKTAVATIGEHAAAELSSRAAVQEKARARDAVRVKLLAVLEPVRRTARALAIDMPGVDGKFRLPSTQAPQTLLVAARACARDARELSAPLVAHGLPLTFLGDVDGAVQAFENAIRDHDASRSSLVAARTGLKNGIQAGLIAVQRLDGIVPNQLRGDPPTAAVWEAARRVEIRRRARIRARKPSEQPALPASDTPAVH